MGLGIDINHSYDEEDPVYEGGGEAVDESKCLGNDSCSVCLEALDDDERRSRAKLRCGHQFHLDCIGSAFNAKGIMQCPNCRDVEKGRWLYANGCRPYPEFFVEDYWTHDEDLYDFSYPEMSIGVHWCPFGGVSRLPALFEDGEFSPSSYNDMLGPHAAFSEQTPLQSGTHPCPYIAYIAPVPPSSSNSRRNVPESSLNSPSPWASSVSGEMASSYTFPAMDVHYHSWEQHPSPFGSAGVDQSSVTPHAQRSSQSSSDGPRSGPLMHPFLVGHSPSVRPGSGVSSMVPPYPGSNARTHDRIQALQAYYQQQQPSNSLLNLGPSVSATWRSNRGMASMGPVASSSDQSNRFYVNLPGRNSQDRENSLSSRFNLWDRDQQAPYFLNHNSRNIHRGALLQASDGSNQFRQRQGAERTSQSRR